MATKNEATEEAGKPNETKREKFVRLANSRTGKALDAVANLGGLANPTNYEYNAEDWVKIFTALETELSKLQARVKNPATKIEGGFSL